MPLDDILLYGLIFAVVLVPALFAQVWTNRSGDTKRVFDSARVPGIYRLARIPISILCSLGIGDSLAKMNVAKTKKLAHRIIVANIKLTPEMVYAAQVFYALFLGIATVVWMMVLSIDQVWIAFGLLIGFFIGWVFPPTVVESAADKRQTEIIRSLPFAIDLITSAMRSGLDFGAAIRYYVSLASGGALGVEFGIMLRQIELGKTRVEALNNMAERIATKEFNSFVSSVAHGTEIGASIAETMNIQGEELRRARFNLAERKAARAPSIMILPMAIFILPAVFIIIFTPVYIKVSSGGMAGIFSRAK